MPEPEELNPFASPQAASTASARAAKGRFISGHSSAVLAMVGLGLTVFARLLLAACDYSIIRILHRPLVVPFLVADEISANAARYALIGVIHFVAFCFAGLAFMNWFYRVSRNLRALGNRNVEWSPGWTIGGWLIPIGCLFIPYQVMAEIWRGSDPALAVHSPDSPGRSLNLVRSWWALWVIISLGGFVERITSHLHAVPSIEVMRAWTWCDFGIDLLAVPAAVLAILVVRDVDASQHERHRLVGELHAQQTAADQPSYLSTIATNGPAADSDMSFLPPAAEPSSDATADQGMPTPWFDD